MSKITRQTMQIFGSNAGANQIEQFGSLASGVPVYTTNIATIQALANYLVGWFGGVVGANLPAIEDLNAICYLFAYQIAYGLQSGIPEWDAGTTYFIGSVAQDGLGNAFVSITDTNLNNALTSTANWKPQVSSYNTLIITPSSSPYTLTLADRGRTFLVQLNVTPTPMTFILSAAALGKNFSFKIKDAGAKFNLGNCTLQRFAAESIEGLGANYVMSAPSGEWQFTSDGTNIWITGR